MRKAVLFLSVIFMMVSNAEATNGKNVRLIKENNRYNDETVSFVERGIVFYVFLNGDFDFDTHHDEPRYVDYYGRRTRIDRGGVRIERDYSGRVLRVGNVFINYDFRGNVTRIGSVYLSYRRGYLIRVGGLRIDYDRWGDSYFYGSVKFNDPYCDVAIDTEPIYDYDNQFFYRRNFRENYRRYQEDDNFYYYRANPDAKVDKKRTIIKRRKQSANTKNRFNKHENRRRGSRRVKKQHNTPARTRSRRN